MAQASERQPVLTLYAGDNDPYSHRLRLVLAEKDIAARIILVDPLSPPEDLPHLNPYNSLPTLCDRDVSLYESRLAIEYLDERFPQPPLLPTHPAARARLKQLAWRIDREWSPSADCIVAARSTPQQVALARKTLRDSLTGVAPVFAEKPFFMHDEFSMVDCLLAPLLWRLPILGIELPERPCRPLLRYMQTLFARPSFITSLTDAERDLRSR